MKASSRILVNLNPATSISFSGPDIGNPHKAQKEAIFHALSPICHAHKIEVPTLLLQGGIDEVVPSSHALEMERVLKGNERDVRLVMFEGERH